MRPSHSEREQNLRTFMLAAAILDSDVRDGLEPSDFSQREMGVIECIKKPAAGVQALDNWLRRELGVERLPSEKVLDACKRQLAHDSVLAEMERVGGDAKFEAQMFRIHELINKRRLKEDRT